MSNEQKAGQAKEGLADTVAFLSQRAKWAKWRATLAKLSGARPMGEIIDDDAMTFGHVSKME